MKWVNDGYCRFSVKAMAVAVATKPVPKSIWKQHYSQIYLKEILSNQISNKNSTKQYLKRRPWVPDHKVHHFFYQKQLQEKSPQHFFCTNTSKSKLMTFNNMFSADCIRSEFCHVVFLFWLFQTFLVEIFLHIFGRDFSSGIFFVEIFLHMFLTRKMSLERLFGRDFFWFAKCLVRASLVYVFGRNFCWDNFW